MGKFILTRWQDTWQKGRVEGIGELTGLQFNKAQPNTASSPLRGTLAVKASHTCMPALIGGNLRLSQPRDSYLIFSIESITSL